MVQKEADTTKQTSNVPWSPNRPWILIYRNAQVYSKSCPFVLNVFLELRVTQDLKLTSDIWHIAKDAGKWDFYFTAAAGT